MATTGMPKPVRRRWWWLVVPAILIGAAAGGGLWFLPRHLGLRPGMPLFQPPFGGRLQVNVLILGLDSESEPHRSDTIMLAALDLARHRIGVISVPRDFRVDIPGHSAQKINAAYSLGGVELTARTVEALTGVHRDYYVTVTSAGLKQLVDALGGVEVDVDKRMVYRDRSQGLFINLYPGPQRLNGEQAVWYVRYRHDPTGDLARIRRQQAFIHAVMREALAPRNLARLPALLKLFSQAVETDLTLSDLVGAGKLARALDPGQVKARTLPGAPVDIAGVSYLEPDYNEMPHIIAEVLYGARPRVAIVNATAIPGVEAGLVRRLGGEGYEVTERRFANHTSAASQVVDRADHPDEAKQILGWLHCGAISRANREAIAGADITVLLGTDYIGR